jgi:hypothetical protein
MRIIAGGLIALAFAAVAVPAGAQGVPQGSYLRSCGEAHMEGRTLVAVCRRADGRPERTALDVNRCVGDIGNINGQLQCNGGQPAPTQYGGPPPGERRYGEERREEWRERCERLGHEEHELRERLERTRWGEERERLEHRLREVHEDRERCYRR